MVTLTAAESFHCRLHYAEAVLSELFRISSVAPVTPPHRATKDTTLKGYFIPKVCIGGSVFSETCILATQLHPHLHGDGYGVYNPPGYSIGRHVFFSRNLSALSGGRWHY